MPCHSLSPPVQLPAVQQAGNAGEFNPSHPPELTVELLLWETEHDRCPHLFLHARFLEEWCF